MNSRSPVMWTTVNPGSGSAQAAAADRLMVVDPEAAAEHEHDGPVGREVELPPALVGAPLEHGPRHRPAGDLIPGRILARDRERQEHAAREGRTEAVGEPQVRVDLEERRRDPQHAGGGEHRAGDIARRRRRRRPGAPRAGCGRSARGPARRGRDRARAPATASAGVPRRGTCGAAYPAAGTSRASIRSAVPANATDAPLAVSSAATASDGTTWPAVPPAAISTVVRRSGSRAGFFGGIRVGDGRSDGAAFGLGHVEEGAGEGHEDDQARAA